MQLVDLNTAEHYSWGNGCEGWHLVKQQALSVIQERVPPGQAEVKHWHGRSRQFFYILSGQATIVVGDRTIELHPFAGVEIPPGASHQFRNDTDSDVTFLVISVPPSQGDRFEGDWFEGDRFEA